MLQILKTKTSLEIHERKDLGFQVNYMGMDFRFYFFAN